MNETMLTLKAGVTLIEKGSQVGLILKGRVQFAKDVRQTEIMRVLVAKPHSPDSLLTLLQTQVGSSESDNKISLAIAEFILDFGEYLQS